MPAGLCELLQGAPAAGQAVPRPDRPSDSRGLLQVPQRRRLRARPVNSMAPLCGAPTARHASLSLLCATASPVAAGRPAHWRRLWCDLGALSRACVGCCRPPMPAELHTPPPFTAQTPGLVMNAGSDKTANKVRMKCVSGTCKPYRSDETTVRDLTLFTAAQLVETAPFSCCHSTLAQGGPCLPVFLWGARPTSEVLRRAVSSARRAPRALEHHVALASRATAAPKHARGRWPRSRRRRRSLAGRCPS